MAHLALPGAAASEKPLPARPGSVAMAALAAMAVRPGRRERIPPGAAEICENHRFHQERVKNGGFTRRNMWSGLDFMKQKWCFLPSNSSIMGGFNREVGKNSAFQFNHLIFSGVPFHVDRKPWFCLLLPLKIVLGPVGFPIQKRPWTSQIAVIVAVYYYCNPPITSNTRIWPQKMYRSSTKPKLFGVSHIQWRGFIG